MPFPHRPARAIAASITTTSLLDKTPEPTEQITPPSEQVNLPTGGFTQAHLSKFETKFNNQNLTI
jgi:hypothetical protein